jgi:hypothetical protein
VTRTKVLNFLKENSIAQFSEYLDKYIHKTFHTKLEEKTSNTQFLQHVRESSDFSSNDQASYYIRLMLYEELMKHITSVEYLQLLKTNSMVSLKNTIIEQICDLLFEEIKWDSCLCNLEKIRFLDKAIIEADDMKKLLSININEQTALVDIGTTNQVPQINDILELVNKICTLSINGVYIRQYMQDLEKIQRDLVNQKENIVRLPSNAQSSCLMQKLRALV